MPSRSPETVASFSHDLYIFLTLPLHVKIKVGSETSLSAMHPPHFPVRSSTTSESPHRPSLYPAHRPMETQVNLHLSFCLACHSPSITMLNSSTPVPFHPQHQLSCTPPLMTANCPTSPFYHECYFSPRLSFLSPLKGK